VRLAKPTPTGVERLFGEDEIIVSKTDPKGIITYTNGTFLRVSAYTEEQILGQPHNVIRHPDMPRSIFQLMWDTVEAGEEMFAYVLNLAGDGAHYWVFAHVTPTFGPHGRIIGHHSNRRLPDRLGVDRATAAYAAVLAEEAKHRDKSSAIAAGSALLMDLLAQRGQSYDEFVWSLNDPAAAPVGATR